MEKDGRRGRERERSERREEEKMISKGRSKRKKPGREDG